MPYAPEEKYALVTRCKQGDPIAKVSKESGVSRATLYRWISQADAIISCEKQYSPRDVFQLERRVEKLENIVRILKTVDCMASSPLKVRLAALEKLYEQYEIHTICEALDVPRGTFYNHMRRNQRDNAWFVKRREEYRDIIREAYYEFDQIFGANKITAILQSRGHTVSQKFVREIMNDMNLYSIRSDAKEIYQRTQVFRRKQNVLQRNFQADEPNRIWVSDITYFRLNNKWIYICVIIDLFSRRVVAHHISRRQSTQLINFTLRKAYQERLPAAGLIFHTDRGGQYVSHAFQKSLLSYDMVHSYSDSGKPQDNAVIESFFSSLKREELYRREYSSEAAFRKEVDEYMFFYNNVRPHSALKYKTPAYIEQAYYAQKNVSSE